MWPPVWQPSKRCQRDPDIKAGAVMGQSNQAESPKIGASTHASDEHDFGDTCDVEAQAQSRSSEKGPRV